MSAPRTLAHLFLLCWSYADSVRYKAVGMILKINLRKCACVTNTIANIRASVHADVLLVLFFLRVCGGVLVCVMVLLCVLACVCICMCLLFSSRLRVYACAYVLIVFISFALVLGACELLSYAYLFATPELFMILRHGPKASAQQVKWMASAISGANSDLFYWITPLEAHTFRTA